MSPCDLKQYIIDFDAPQAEDPDLDAKQRVEQVIGHPLVDAVG